MQETQTPPKKNWLYYLKLVIGVILLPILAIIYIVDRILCLPIIWRVQYPIQDVYSNLRLVVPILVRLSIFIALTAIYWLITAIF